MTPERWQEVKQALSDVLALPAAEREPYLRTLRLQSADVALEVESLLPHDAEAHFLEQPAIAFMALTTGAAFRQGRVWLWPTDPRTMQAGLRRRLAAAGVVCRLGIAVEAVTGWPGIGRLMLDALVGRDLFLVAGCALAGAVLIALGNVTADVIRAVVDPRIGHA